MRELREYKKLKRITLAVDELLIIDAPEGFIVNAESTYGYGMGDVELRIDAIQNSQIEKGE